MVRGKQFCAVESERAGDPLPGTATHAERNLLLSWPRQRWKRNLRHATDMDPQLTTNLDELAASGRRVNLIYRRSETGLTHRAFLFPECLTFDIEPQHLNDFVEDVRQGRELARWAATPAHKPVMLCCTHGKKDKCCARFGYATYRQLQQAIDEQDLPVDLWESSHLGGCRLAASVVILPSRRKYGRIGAEHVLPLLAHETRGQPYLPCYRGNGGLTPAQQCAEAAALEWLGVHQDGESVTLSVGPEEKPRRPAADVQVQVRWQTDNSHGLLVADCQQRSILRVDTCADLDEGPTPSQCWQALSVVTA